MPVTAGPETLLAQVWSSDVRPLAEEAWRSYNAGATGGMRDDARDS